MEFQQEGPGSGIPVGDSLDEFTSLTVTELFCRKRQDGDVRVLFRRGFFRAAAPLQKHKVEGFLCEAFSFKVDSCCYSIYTSFWQCEALFSLKATMTCGVGLGIGSCGVIPAALTLFWVNKSDGCRSGWRNCI